MEGVLRRDPSRRDLGGGGADPGMRARDLGAVALAGLFGPTGPARGEGSLIGWGAPGSATAGDPSAGEYADLLGRLAAAGDEAATGSCWLRGERARSGGGPAALVTTGQVAVAFWSDRVTGVAVNPAEGLAAGMALWRAAG